MAEDVASPRGTHAAGGIDASMSRASVCDEGWEEAAQSALRSAAVEHAAALQRERAAAQSALQRALGAEAALRALPEALQRAQTAEERARVLEQQVLAASVGSEAKAAVRAGLRTLQPPAAMITEEAAQQAAAQAAAAGWAAADAEARADGGAHCTAIALELGDLEAQYAHSASGAARWEAEHAEAARELRATTERMEAMEREIVLLRADLNDARDATAAATATCSELEAELREARDEATAAASRVAAVEAEAEEEAARAEAGELAARRAASRAEVMDETLRDQVARQLDALDSIAAMLSPRPPARARSKRAAA